MRKGALYVEIDKFAAAWLRELIAWGLIADGDVYEGSFEDLAPADLDRYVQVHLCAGIGVWSYAMRQAGWPDDRPAWTASFPCQPFSAAGQGAGFADERHLWPTGHWLIDQCRPVILFGEQVASRPGLEWFDLVSSDLEGSGYTVGAHDLCAAGLGAPHIRQRLYFVAHHHQERQFEHAKCNGQPLAGPDRKAPCRNDPGRRGGHGADGILADDDGARPAAHRSDAGQVRGLQEAQRQPEHSAAVPGRGGGASEVGDTPDPGPLPGPHGRICCGEESFGSRNAESQRRGVPGSVVDAAGEQARLPRCSRLAGGAGGLDNPVRIRRSENGRDIADYLEAHGRGPKPEFSDAGTPSTFWAGSDWIPCRDGKYRPVESGTFPLAHGSPARVGRLRGYGNGLVAPVAEAFIRAVMACL